MIEKVLFVCVHNSGRSQMACAFINSLSNGTLRAECSGTMPSDSVNPQVVEVMNEVGLDLSANVPSIITQLQVDDANLVITMGCSVEECPINNFHVDEDWKLEGPTQPAHPRCSQDSRRDQNKGYSFVG